MKNSELKEIKDSISKIKHPRLNRILESDKIDSAITKIQNIYYKIYNKLVVKYNLEDELKQGKIFTILFALLAFVLLVLVTVFFTITLNSIIGIGLIFSVLRQIIFCIKWGYTIIKNKGKNIKKYLSNLFPNSKVLQEVNVRKKIPLYEEQILYQIEDFLDTINKEELPLELEKELSLKLKKIVNMLHLNNLDFKDEIKSIEYKKDISKKLMDIENIYQNYINKKNQENDFIELKNDVLEQINEIESKVYVKKL